MIRQFTQTRRRLCQFRLRTLVLVTFVLSLYMSCVAVNMEKAKRQQEATIALENLGYEVAFNSNETSSTFDSFFCVSRENAYFIHACRGRVTDDDLTLIRRLRPEVLYLQDTTTSDGGLQELRGLDSLKELWLENTLVTDVGLVHVETFRNLSRLHLNGTSVSDNGLASLCKMKSLMYVDLSDTTTTQEGIKRLQEALPNCQVFY